MLASASPRKPRLRDAFEVVERRDLAGGMPRDGQRQLVALPMPLPSSLTLQQLGAAARELHADVMRAGVEAVFEQFLQGGGGPLDDFAGGDLVDQKIRQHANIGHGKL